MGLTVSTTLGAFTAGSVVAFAVAAVLLAMVSAGLCLALRVGPPGSYFLVLCAGIAHLLVGEHGVEPWLVPAMTAVGATVAWLITMLELLPDPRKPERAAVRGAQDAVADYAASEPGPASRPAHRAAAHALAAAEEAMVEGMWTRSATFTADLNAARVRFDERAAREIWTCRRRDPRSGRARRSPMTTGEPPARCGGAWRTACGGPGSPGPWRYPSGWRQRPQS